MQSVALDVDGQRLMVLVSEEHYQPFCEFVKNAIALRDDVARFVFGVRLSYQSYMASCAEQGVVALRFTDYLDKVRRETDSQMTGAYRQEPPKEEPVIPQPSPETRGMFGMFKAKGDLTTGAKDGE